MSNLQPSRDTLLAISLTFGVLGKTLFQEPEKAALSQLVREQVFTEIPFGENQTQSQKGITILSEWTNRNGDGLSQASFDEIRHDFLYLFAGVGRPLASPWESTYFNEAHITFDKQTLEVRKWYQDFGLAIERKHKEPDDQIGYELSFIAHLSQKAYEAEDEAVYVKAIHDFLCEHLLRWAFVWSVRVEQNARSGFYKGIGLLVSGSLQALANTLGIDAHSIKQCPTPNEYN